MHEKKLVDKKRIFFSPHRGITEINIVLGSSKIFASRNNLENCLNHNRYIWNNCIHKISSKSNSDTYIRSVHGRKCFFLLLQIWIFFFLKKEPNPKFGFIFSSKLGFLFWYKKYQILNWFFFLRKKKNTLFKILEFFPKRIQIWRRKNSKMLLHCFKFRDFFSHGRT